MNWEAFFIFFSAIAGLGGILALVTWASVEFGNWVYAVFVGLVVLGLAVMFGLVVP